jgi:hypothetical protein
MPHDRHGDQGDALAASVIARRRYDAMLPSSQSIREHSTARLVLEWIILLRLWTIDRFPWRPERPTDPFGSGAEGRVSAPTAVANRSRDPGLEGH